MSAEAVQLAVRRDGAKVTHLWACSGACAVRAASAAQGATWRPVPAPPFVRTCAGCGQSIGGGARR